MDVIGPINPKASNGHRFILVAIDYFTKWIEAQSFKEVTANNIIRFTRANIIARYGVPELLVTDNGTNFNGKQMNSLCTEFRIKHLNSSPYRPQMNGAVEAANKNMKRILQKTAITYRDWHEKLPFALLAYRTTMRTSTGATPFELVYGAQAVIPTEVKLPTLRILSQSNMTEEEKANHQLAHLDFIDEKRLAAIDHMQCYQQRMSRAFNKKVKEVKYKPGDLVLKRILPNAKDPRGKFAANYEGPFVVKHAFSGGATILTKMDGGELSQPINADALWRYYT
ncbi:hypothetical protein MLD38_036375 [Melastoma candidum]|uniref:Uncharacterized protein n=1 Tax=Melastoma candidum TaxID=119954 RepID=A0ACB9LKG3_9MYRT|nr:hypothetical protein MLD38_036375 [Melastoma candidum]